MKIDRLFNKGITGMLALAGILCGCAEEEHEISQTVPLSISATCPVLAGDVTTRTTNTEVKIALNATAGGYATTAKTYRVTTSPSITFAPQDADNTWEVTGDLTLTPLTIYGWLDENTPVACSESNIAVSNGNISNVALSPLYACIGVRVVLGKDTERAGTYKISSKLNGIGTASANNDWDTSGVMPVLKAGSSSPAAIKNTDKKTVKEIKASDLTTDYFMRVAPTTIQPSTASLFTITLPNGQQLPIASGAKAITIENGNCYFFTVNIGSETSLTISIEQMTMDAKTTIVLHPDNVPRKPGIFSRNDWDQFVEAYRNRQDITKWLDSDRVLNLYTDIDLNNEEWIPFTGNGDEGFGFNGNGHTIYNLRTISEGGGGGFYAFLYEPYSIKGLTINGVSVISGYNGSSGAFVGSLSGGSVIDCHVKGKVEISAYEFAGGIVGACHNGQGNIYACTFAPDEMPILTAPIAVGGIVGRSEGSYRVMGCIVHDFTFTDEDAELLGGISGMTEGDDICQGCVVYKIKVNRSGYLGCITPTSNYRYCYYYDVFGRSSSESEGANSVAINKLEDLSNKTVITELNVPLYYSLIEPKFHFEASPTPTITGPTIKPGEPEEPILN
ncbi:hypothetical protein HMPREF1212_03368 [Parabacteroides sp. HGS0025]|uniref:hypothetical protein n=1 Tax=Parabacteroides sp. HGS0025 TaxID=1078087 RepID=UPI0006173292|nr:hypothetical protein [Parabacteroides sp. HGS0025]KKB50208.1 hypothetical protein HMPREF1212_03368 [Parabacteroides sp. HGS0025]